MISEFSTGIKSSFISFNSLVNGANKETRQDKFSGLNNLPNERHMESYAQGAKEKLKVSIIYNFKFQPFGKLKQSKKKEEIQLKTSLESKLVFLHAREGEIRPRQKLNCIIFLPFMSYS